MAHEHTGQCGHQQAFEQHHDHQHVHQIGQQCLQGVCAHPEHQALQSQHMLQEQLEAVHRQEIEGTSREQADTKKKKKSAKKLAGLSLSQLLLDTKAWAYAPQS